METSKIIELEKLLSEYKGGQVFNVTKLHGMLVALIIGPTTFQPRVWWPFIFDPSGTEPHFNSQEHGQKIQDLVRELYYDIGSELGNSDAFTFCLNGKTKNATTDLDPYQWCPGFVIGSMFCQDQYAEHLEKKDSVLLQMLGPILYFGEEDSAQELIRLTKGKAEKGKLDQAFLKGLPAAVRDVREYWKGQKRGK